MRFTFRPLPDAVCYFQNIAKTILFFNALLFLGAMIVKRYAYIFWLKNPAPFHVAK